MPSTDPSGLLDVVCGAPTDVTSVHRFVHAGALFCFCSDECLARFIVDPHQFVPGATKAAPRSDVVTPAPRVSNPAKAGDAGPTVAASSADLAQVAAVPTAERVKAKTLGPIPLRSPSSNTLFTSLFAWREKRFAVRTCAELLALHKIVAARYPDLAGAALYRQIVAAHRGGDLVFADAVLDNAEQSFAIWPVQRALRFADVVHYIAASEFLASAGGGRWIHADMKRIVAARIPHDL